MKIIFGSLVVALVAASVDADSKKVGKHSKKKSNSPSTTPSFMPSASAMPSGSPSFEICGSCNKIYWLVTVDKTWQEHKDEGIGFNCRLATISDPTELAAINSAIDDAGGNQGRYTFVGLSRPEICPISNNLGGCARGDPAEGWMWEDGCTEYRNLGFLWSGDSFEPNDFEGTNEYVVGLTINKVGQTQNGPNRVLNDVRGNEVGFAVFECCEDSVP